MSTEPYIGRDNLDVMEVAANYNRWLVDLAAMNFQPGARILDFGAGTGTLTRMFHARGFDVRACEPDAAMARELQRAGIATEQSLTAIPDGSFTGVVSFNVLEHIEDDAAALRALRAKLRAGGRLFLYVPAFPILYSSMDKQVGHHRRYRRAPLKRLLERCGFEVIRCRYADSLGFPAALAYRFLGSSDGLLTRDSVFRYDRWVFPLSRALDSLIAGTLGKNVLIVGVRTDGC
jgi:SAM-dependent methyltransferase